MTEAGRRLGRIQLASLRHSYHSQRAEWLAVIGWVVLAVVVLAAAWRLPMFGSMGPGAGFFIKWLSALLLVLAVGRAVSLYLATSPPPLEPAGPVGQPESRVEPQPETARPDVLRFALAFAALIVYALVLDRAGFTLSAAALIWAIMVLLDRPKIRAAIEASIAAVVLDYSFVVLLGIQLPTFNLSFGP